MEKEDIIEVNSLDYTEFIKRCKISDIELDRDDVESKKNEIIYLELKYNYKGEEHILILSSDGKKESNNFNYDLIKVKQESLRIDLLKISIERLIKSLD